jgi:dTDP-4-dehydrorhamnose reductase
MAFERVTLLGGRGMLGSDVAQIAEQRGIAVTVCDLPEFDITDEQQVRDAVVNADAVVNCAAYTNVEKAESERDLADAVNGYAVGSLGQIAKTAGVPVLHISTDFVFDGTKQEPYTETDQPNPISVYGRSKLLGETLLNESGCEACILRIEWTYGKNGTNFITKILSAAKTKDFIQVVDDQVGSPTHTLEAAKAICDCLEMPSFAKGVFHFAAAGYTSRYDMTRFLFEAMHIPTPVKPCKTSDFQTAAQRPLNSRFSCQKIERLLNRPIRTWQDMLKSYVETL